MNRIIRNLIVAVPLATAALTLTPGAANAETPAPTPGPVIVLPAEPDQPAPKDIAVPAPQPPQDITNPDPQPEPQPEPQPGIPDDKAPVPPKDQDPQIPGNNDEITDTPDCTHGCGEDPTPDFPLDSGCFEDCDLPEDEPQDKPQQNQGAPETDQDTTEIPAITTPTRVDAGLGHNNNDNDLQLTWLLASGALITAGGAAIARKKARSNT